jgi:putative DNA methylase
VNVRSNALLARVDWSVVSARARREQRSRERFTPTISVYRWWARRPHSVIGAVLDAAVDHWARKLRIADPFSGGATVAVEGARRDLPTYAQDLHPWAARGLELTIAPVDVAALEMATEELGRLTQSRVNQLYAATCTHHRSEAETLNTLWVRRVTCSECAEHVYLYPYSLVTLASRARKERHGYFGCRSCGRITRSALKTRVRRCRCGHRLEKPETSLMPKRAVRCPHCRATFAPYARRTSWQIALVQRRCMIDSRRLMHYDVPTSCDRRQARMRNERVPDPLNSAIPESLETNILQRGGFERWSDLYVARQLDVCLAAARIARGMAIAPAVRDRMLLAICGAGEMAGRVSRWDRYYPKAFEALANHRYALVGLACETNPFASMGRGTIPRRLRAIARAARWMATGPSRPVRARSTRRRDPVRFRRGLVVVRGSSERLRLADKSIDLVLTDPPYFDDVQYAELASLFLAWAHATRLVPADVNVDATREVVPNRLRGTGTADYERLLSRIFRETRRVLRRDGAMVLTFHNTEVAAWNALARALRAAGFCVRALAVVRSENETDHVKRGRHGFTKDLVLECVTTKCSAPIVVVRGNDTQDRELLAIGRWLASSTEPTSQSLAHLLERFERPRVTARRLGRVG